MKGLLKKDCYMLAKIGKFYLVFDLLYGVWAAVSGQAMLLAMMNIIFGSLIVKTLMAYEEQSKWDTLAVNLPVSAKTLVREKYVMGFFCILSVNAVTFLVLWLMRTFLHQNADFPLLPFFLLYLFLGVLYVSFQLPVLFKYGTVKGRLVYMVIIALGAGIAGAVNAIFLTGVEETRSLAALAVPQDRMALAAAAVVLVTVAATYLSIGISTRIYKKKEF